MCFYSLYLFTSLIEYVCQGKCCVEKQVAKSMSNKSPKRFITNYYCLQKLV